MSKIELLAKIELLNKYEAMMEEIKAEGRPYERGFLTDGGCVQSVGIGYDTLTGAVRDGKCQSQGSANRAAAGGQRGHPRHLPPPLSRLQEQAVECQRIGKGLRHQQNHSIQIHWTFGSKNGARFFPCSILLRLENHAYHIGIDNSIPRL